MPEALPILQWLAASPVAATIRSSTWLYPVLETLHMIGLGLVFGGIFAMDLRLLGLHRELQVRRLSDHLLPWVWTGFAVNLSSGLLLFLSDAVAFAANPAFQAKMALLVLVGLNAAWFQRRIYADVGEWDSGAPPPSSARAAAVLSLALWTAIIAAGRMIAYWE